MTEIISGSPANYFNNNGKSNASVRLRILVKSCSGRRSIGELRASVRLLRSDRRPDGQLRQLLHDSSAATGCCLDRCPDRCPAVAPNRQSTPLRPFKSRSLTVLLSSRLSISFSTVVSNYNNALAPHAGNFVRCRSPPACRSPELLQAQTPLTMRIGKIDCGHFLNPKSFLLE